MTGDKRFHIFINYRVKTDAALAEKLSDKLSLHLVPRESSLRVKCFLDKKDLDYGKSYEEDFLSGLGSSCLFVPLISEDGLQPLINPSSPSVKDNVLLEYETAKKLWDMEKIHVLPLFIGKNTASGYAKFAGFGSAFPNHPSATNPEGTVAETMAWLFKIQGMFVNPEEIAEKIPFLVEQFGNYWPYYRDSWAIQDELGPEKVVNCVQCETEYCESKNGVGSCASHSGFVGGNGKYSCCGAMPGSKGCERHRHRQEHHQEYVYEKFAAWAGNILFRGMGTPWLEIECENYEGKQPTLASIGYVDRGPGKGKLYVRLGDLTSFFKVYSRAEIVQMIDLQKTTMENTKNVNGGTARAEWIVEDGKLAGAILYAQSETSTVQESYSVRFTLPANPEEAPVCGETKALSKGGIVEKKPAAPYDIPKNQFSKGPVIKEFEIRAPQDDFKTEGDLPLRIKLASKIACNPFRVADSDVFEIRLSLVNLDGEKSLTLMEPVVSYILRGKADSQWKKADTVKLESGTAFPLKLEPSGVAHIGLKIYLKDAKKEELHWDEGNVSFIALCDPLIFDLGFEDAAGNISSLYAEFINWRNPFATDKQKDSFAVYCDDTEKLRRFIVNVKENVDYNQETSFSIRSPGRSFELKKTDLRGYVYAGRKQGMASEVLIPLEIENVALFALIDYACDRVYALKIVITTSTSASISFVELGHYGYVDEVHENGKVPKPSPPEGFVLHERKFLPFASTSTPIPKIRASASGAQPGSNGTGAPGGGAGIDAAALEALLQKLVSSQLTAFESKLEQSLGARLDALEVRLKDLSKSLPAAHPAESSKAPGSSGDLFQQTQSRLDQIAGKLDEISAKVESKGSSSFFKRK